MPKLFRIYIFIWLILLVCRFATADELYNVTLDTSALVGHPAGPFYVAFAFIDGDGYGDGNNTISASNFDFGGGSGLGGQVLVGGVAGSLETGVTITDSSFANLFYEQFAPGLQLSFSLDLTSNDDVDGIPDGLSLFILDNVGNPLPTLAPDGTNYFLSAALGSSGAVFSLYGSDPSQSPSAGGNPVSISAPTVSPVSSPEPKPLWLLGGALALLIVVRRLCLQIFGKFCND